MARTERVTIYVLLTSLLWPLGLDDGTYLGHPYLSHGGASPPFC